MLVAITACGGAPSLSKVDKYVVEACDITRGTEGDEKGQWLPPPMTTEESWSETDPIPELKKIRDGWQERIVPATTAAQLDGTFRPLADAIKAMLDSMVLLVDLRERSWSLESVYDDLSFYNSHLATWRTECNATANRLPK